jgi:hypothetical protein
MCVCSAYVCTCLEFSRVRYIYEWDLRKQWFQWQTKRCLDRDWIQHEQNITTMRSDESDESVNTRCMADVTMTIDLYDLLEWELGSMLFAWVRFNWRIFEEHLSTCVHRWSCPRTNASNFNRLLHERLLVSIEDFIGLLIDNRITTFFLIFSSVRTSILLVDNSSITSNQ